MTMLFRLVVSLAALLAPTVVVAQSSLSDLLGSVLTEVRATSPDRVLGIAVDSTVLGATGKLGLTESGLASQRLAMEQGLRSGPKSALIPCPTANPLECSFVEGINGVVKFQVEKQSSDAASVLVTLWTRYDGEGWVLHWREYRASAIRTDGKWQVTKMELVRYS